MSAVGVETRACNTALEIVRCHCGAHMQYVSRSEDIVMRGWKHLHRCLRESCGSEEWLDKKFPRLLVYDEHDKAEPMFIIDPSQIGYS